MRDDTAMYNYEYEPVSCTLCGWGLGSGNVYQTENYRALIDRRAVLVGSEP